MRTLSPLLTLHAVKRYRQRIEDLSDAEIERVLLVPAVMFALALSRQRSSTRTMVRIRDNVEVVCADGKIVTVYAHKLCRKSGLRVADPLDDGQRKLRCGRPMPVSKGRRRDQWKNDLRREGLL